jgi:hypothetical protein
MVSTNFKSKFLNLHLNFVSHDIRPTPKILSVQPPKSSFSSIRITHLELSYPLKLLANIGYYFLHVQNNYWLNATVSPPLAIPRHLGAPLNYNFN